MLAARQRAVRDRRDLAESPEAIAVVHKRLGAYGQAPSANSLVGLLKRADKGVFPLKPERVANEAKVGINHGAGGTCDLRQQLAKFLFYFGAANAGQPAARSLQPAFLRILIEDLAAMNLTDEDAFAARGRIGAAAQFPVKLCKSSH